MRVRGLRWAAVVVVVVGSGLVVGGDRASGAIQFGGEWGSAGSGDGQFSSPGGVATDASGNVYVADRLNNRIQKFTSTGAFLTKWGSSGPGDGQFHNPAGVATDAFGNVYVVANSRIQKFTSTGAFLTKWGSSGSGDSQFNSPAGVATDASGNVYVADFGNHRIQKFTSTGTFLTKWGTNGTGDGLFSYPFDVTTDGSGNVYVADVLNFRIQKFTSTGAFLTKWGSGGSGDSQFFFPLGGVTTDGSGNVYVADQGNDRIQKFTSTGAFLTKWGTNGAGDSRFNHPLGVDTDASGNVYLTDANNHRIQRFAQIAPETSIASGPSGLTNDPTPTFTFSSNSTNATFECSIDSADFTSCPQSFTTPLLGDGPHNLQVRAVDSEGTDATPDQRLFTVGELETFITSKSFAKTTKRAPTFSFTSNGSEENFECSLDGADFTPCVSPHTTEKLSRGLHTFQVAAKEGSMVDQTPASQTFKVVKKKKKKKTFPVGELETFITSRPFIETTDRAPTFSFTSNRPEASFQCSLDGADFTPCVSPHATGKLSTGRHTFQVRAEEGRVVDPTPASYTFKVVRKKR